MKDNYQSSYYDFLKYSRKRNGTHVPEVPELLSQFDHESLNKDLFPSVLYSIDYTENSYSFRLFNMDKFLGYSSDFLFKTSPSFLNEIRNKEDLSIFNEQIFPDQMSFLAHHAKENRCQYIFTTNFRVKNFSNAWSVVIQRTRYLFNEYDRIPVASINSLTDITYFKNDSKINHLIEQFDEKRQRRVVENKCYYSKDSNDLLSKREVDVLKLASKGLGSKEIAEELNISIHTINNHRRNMLSRSNCKNILQLVDRAVKNGTL